MRDCSPPLIVKLLRYLPQSCPATYACNTLLVVFLRQFKEHVLEMLKINHNGIVGGPEAVVAVAVASAASLHRETMSCSDFDKVLDLCDSMWPRYCSGIRSQQCQITPSRHRLVPVVLAKAIWKCNQTKCLERAHREIIWLIMRVR